MFNFIPRILQICTIIFRVFSVYVHTASFIVLSVYIQLHSAYYRYTYSFFLRIIRICTISFCVLSEYVQFHSAYYRYTYSFILHIDIRAVSFCVLSDYVQFHSAYSQYICTLGFIPRPRSYSITRRWRNKCREKFFP